MSMLDTRSHLDEAGPTPDPSAGKPPRWPFPMVVLVVAIGLAAVVLLLTAGALAFLASGNGSDEAITAVAEEVEEPIESSEPAEGSEPANETPAQSTTVASTTQTTAAPQAPALPADCSASGLSWNEQPGLPGPVAEKRAAILDAATSCDLARLVALTGPDFMASLGGGDAAKLWAEQEANGQEPMRFLVELLTMPHRKIRGADATEYYTWPSAFGLEPTEALSDQDRADLARLYSEDQIAVFEESGYAGYRIIIYDGGSWVTFVGGD